ncbi:MAG TPA: FixH family protein [Gemmatimonadales bacterium]|nr:FixH family protein [Gemmatimonadales bacterium]
MTRTWKRAAAGVGLAVLGLVGTGMAFHHGLTGAHRPDDREFGLGPRRSAGGRYVASLQAARPIELRKLLTMRIVLTDSTGGPVDGATLAVDGGMPEHRHGLPTRPRVTRPLGQGTYQVDGVKFNMGGWWVLTFRVDAGAARDSVTFNLDL